MPQSCLVYSIQWKGKNQFSWLTKVFCFQMAMWKLFLWFASWVNVIFSVGTRTLAGKKCLWAKFFFFIVFIIFNIFPYTNNEHSGMVDIRSFGVNQGTWVCLPDRCHLSPSPPEVLEGSQSPYCHWHLTLSRLSDFCPASSASWGRNIYIFISLLGNDFENLFLCH